MNQLTSSESALHLRPEVLELELALPEALGLDFDFEADFFFDF